MKTDYEGMSDAELDKAACEMLGYKLVDVNLVGQTISVWVDPKKTPDPKEVERIGDNALVANDYIFKLKKNWNPTHPDSNQCERYLFPKLEAMMLEAGAEHVAIGHNKNGRIYKVWIDCDAPIKTVIPAKESWRIDYADVVFETDPPEDYKLGEGDEFQECPRCDGLGWTALTQEVFDKIHAKYHDAVIFEEKIKTLEEENAKLKADLIKAQEDRDSWAEDSISTMNHRDSIDAENKKLTAELKAARKTVKNIADQKTSKELFNSHNDNEYDSADFEGAYDIMINDCREALTQLSESEGE